MNAAPDQFDAAYCANLVRSSDFERYGAALFMEAASRRALLAIYAFNIEISRIREQISQPLAGEIRLQWWNDLLAGTAHGGAQGNPVAAELLRTIERFGLPRELATRMLDAHRVDLYDEPMATMTELENYLQDTASALFLFGVRILGGDMRDEPARHAGLAFGLNRIVEALARHASRGQIYLPVDELGRAGVQPADILAGRTTPELRQYLQHLAEQARQHLRLAHELLSRERTRSRVAFLPLALLEGKLRQICSASYDPFEVRPMSNLAILWTLWRASRREPFRS